MSDDTKLFQLKLRIPRDLEERTKYWASRRDISRNEYIREAIEEKIARENKDYDLPTLEIARLNELNDNIRALSTSVGNLSEYMVSGFDSLMGLTRGDNYLLDEESGEL